jgi:AraC-like DNA-binding protein
MLARPPRHPALRDLVQTLWVSEPGAVRERPGATREWVLPTGTMHLVFRVSGPPLRLYEDLADSRGCVAGTALVGGARATPYLRDISEPVGSVGVQLRPGAALRLLGAPADALADAHTPLEELWGADARRAYEQLCELDTPEAKLEHVEALLRARLARGRTVATMVPGALAQLAAGADLRTVVAQSGYSHRHFIARFRQAVGLTPKLFGRVLRFQRALAQLSATPAATLAEVALAAGYSDQSHFTREFQDLAGISPGRYRALAPGSPNHLPVVKMVQDAARR